MGSKFSWDNMPMYYNSLMDASKALTELMSKPSNEAVILTDVNFGRYDRIDIKLIIGRGWSISYVDNNSFVKYLNEVMD